MNQINETLRNLKLAAELKPNVTIEKYSEIRSTCRSDYGDLVRDLCKSAKAELETFERELKNAKGAEQLKELKKSVLNATSNFEVEATAADLANDLAIRETLNEFKALNKRIDDKIQRLINEERKRSPVNAKIKKETKSHLIKSNSETLVGSQRINRIHTGNELTNLLKEMVLKLDSLIRKGPTEAELRSYLATLKEVCAQSSYVRENEPQLNEELSLIDQNLEVVRTNLMSLISSSALDSLIDWRFEVRRSSEVRLKEVDFRTLRSSGGPDSKQVLEKLELDCGFVDEYHKLTRLMEEAHEWLKDFECKLDYLPLRTLDELLDNYKATIFSVEILKARLLDGIEMFNSRQDDCLLDAELLGNPILDDLEVLRDRYEQKCKELFEKFASESQAKIKQYIQKCSHCSDRNEFQYMLAEVKEFDVLNTNRINKIISSTRESLDKLLGKLQEDANNNLAGSSDQPTADGRLSSDLSDSNNMIYVCEICIDSLKCTCVPSLEETEVPAERRRRSTRTKRGSSARNSLNLTADQWKEIEKEQADNQTFDQTNNQADNRANGQANSQANSQADSQADKEIGKHKKNQENTEQSQETGDQELDEHLKFEVWLEAMSNTVEFLLNEKKSLDESDFQEVCLYLRKMQQLKHALKLKFNHPANSNRKILNQYKMIFLTIEREVCLLKRQVEKLRHGTPINLPLQNRDGRVVCQNGVHLNHFCNRFRRNFFTRLFKVTLPLQVILLTMFGISSLLSPNQDDFRCSLRNSLGPTYGFPDGQPPV